MLVGRGGFVVVVLLVEDILLVEGFDVEGVVFTKLFDIHFDLFVHFAVDDYSCGLSDTFFVDGHSFEVHHS